MSKGPTLRTDVIDVYVFRCLPNKQVEFLQLHRCKGEMNQTWQPVMGHSLRDESAAETAVRELREETGIGPGRSQRPLEKLWQLEEPNIYFLAHLDVMMLGPCFAARVAADCEPMLNDEHDASRWIRHDHVDRHFLWPGQRKAIQQILRDIVPDDSPASPILEIDLNRFQ